MTTFIHRFKARRHDKLQLWVLLIIGVAVPIFLCWVLPNVLSAQRNAEEEAMATATAVAASAFRTAHAELFELCGSAPAGTAGSAATGTMPENPNILMIQYERPADVQFQLAETWQFNASRPATVVVCLDREVALGTDTCKDGTTPNLSSFQIERGQMNPNAVVEEIRLLRFVIDVTIFDAQTGAMIGTGEIFGSDPGICSEPDGGSLSGERITPHEIEAWLSETFGS